MKIKRRILANLPSLFLNLLIFSCLFLGTYSHAATPPFAEESRVLTLLNDSDVETLQFSINENVTIQFTDTTQHKHLKIDLGDFTDSTEYLKKERMAEIDNGDGTYTYTYTFNTKTLLGGQEDWYYFSIEMISPKGEVSGNFVVGSSDFPYWIKTYGDSGYTAETDEFGINDTIYVEVVGDYIDKDTGKGKDNDDDESDDDKDDKDKPRGKAGHSDKDDDDKDDDGSKDDDDKDDDGDKEDKDNNKNEKIKAKVKVIDFSENKYIDKSIESVTEDSGVYRFSIDLSSSRKTLTTDWWYSLTVVLEEKENNGKDKDKDDKPKGKVRHGGKDDDGDDKDDDDDRDEKDDDGDDKDDDDDKDKKDKKSDKKRFTGYKLIKILSESPTGGGKWTQQKWREID